MVGVFGGVHHMVIYVRWAKKVCVYGILIESDWLVSSLLGRYMQSLFSRLGACSCFTNILATFLIV